MDDGGKRSLADKYDITMDKLDPDYIEKCANLKELEKIVKVLRSGEEGCYPHLEEKCELKIQSLNSKSRVLRKETPVKSTADIGDKENLINDLKSWTSEIKSKEKDLINKKVADGENLPPVRGVSGSNMVISGTNKNSSVTQTTQKKKSPMPKSHKDWDKIISKLDENEEQESSPAVSHSGEGDSVTASKKYKSLTTDINTVGLTELEREQLANREKDKGNEAFRSGDFHEAIAYYNRSLSIDPCTATYNNRALAYIRVNKWTEATSDCNKVLEAEPDNIKAKLRRACAYKSLRRFKSAKEDLSEVLVVEPNNKRAKDMLKEVDKELDKGCNADSKGRRMVIEETDGETTDEEKTENETTAADTSHRSSQPSSHDISHDTIQSKTEETVRRIQIEEESGDSSEDEQLQSFPTKEIQHTEDTCVTQPASQVNSDESTRQQSASPSEADKVSFSDDRADLTEDNSKRPPSRSNSLYNIIQQKISESSKADQSNISSSEGALVHGEGASGQETSEHSVRTSCGSCADPLKVEAPEIDKKVMDSGEKVVFELGSSKSTASEPDVVTHEEASLVVKVPPPPADSEKLKLKGNDYFKAGQYSDAVTYYTKAIEILKDPSQAYNKALLLSNRSAGYLKLGDSRAAINDSTSALVLVPHNTKALLRRAAAYETVEKYIEAYVDYRHVTNLDPNANTAFAGASRCEAMLKNEFGAKWRNNLPKIPSCSSLPVYEFLNEAETSGSSHWSEAPPKLEALPKLEAPPKFEALPQSRAHDILSVEKSKTSAAQSVTPTESLEERFTKLKDLGNAMVTKNDYNQAARYYTDAISLCPDNIVPYSNRALCYLKLDQPELAIKDCDTVLACEPNHVKALFRRALAYKALSKYKQSLTDLMALLKLEPKNAAALKESDLIKESYKQQLTSMKTETSKNVGNPPLIASSNSKDSKGSKSSQTTRVTVEDDKEKKNPDIKVNETVVKSKNQKKSKQAAKKVPPSSPVNIVKTAPTLSANPTPYEFTQAWSSLKNCSDNQLYAQLIRQIPPSKIASVVSNKLDADMLEKIIVCLDEHFTTEELDLVEDYIRCLSYVQRFSMITMLVSASTKKKLEKLFKKLEARSSQVGKLRLAYGV